MLLSHSRWIALLVVALAPAFASAQDRPYYGPYSVYGPGLTYIQRPTVSPFSTTTIGVQTSVLVPDGGTALVAGYSTYREGRNEFGTPVLGKIPIAGRPFRNVGYGYAIQSSTVTVRVRVIDLREEEARLLQQRR